jgi:hypothetical protein
MPRKENAVTGNLLEVLLRTGLKPRAVKAVFVESDMALKGEATFEINPGKLRAGSVLLFQKC